MQCRSSWILVASSVWWLNVTVACSSLEATNSPSATDDTGGVETDTDTGPPPSGPAVFISEVVDHQDIANAKYIEIFNGTGAAIDLSQWSIERYANGASASPAIAQLTGTLAPATAYVVAYNGGQYQSAFGTPPDQSDNAISGNGDDTYVLVYDASMRVDIYGEVGTDGSGLSWDYEDKVARRSPTVTGPNGTWQATEWTITPGAAQATPGVR